MMNHSWNYMCSKMCKKKRTLLKAHVHAVQMYKYPKRFYMTGGIVLRAAVLHSDAIQHLLSHFTLFFDI